MVQITEDGIAKLGKLARIGISDEVAQTLAPQLTRILDYIAQLQTVDTRDAELTNQVTDLTDIWREDRVIPSRYSREELLRNTPETKDGYIKVRRIL